MCGLTPAGRRPFPAACAQGSQLEPDNPPTEAGPEAAQQALDQELVHAVVAGQCETILSRIVGQVMVYRPANALFIRFELQHLPGNWRAYGPTDSQRLINPPLDASKNPILLTIGRC